MAENERDRLVKMAVLETGEYMRLWMRREILARHGVSLDEYLHDRDLACRSDIAREIAEESMPTQLIVGGFSQSGSPFLLYTDCVNVQEQTNPGFFCGGAGAVQALDWLNLRGQNGFMSIQRTDSPSYRQWSEEPIMFCCCSTDKRRRISAPIKHSWAGGLARSIPDPRKYSTDHTLGMNFPTGTIYSGAIPRRYAVNFSNVSGSAVIIC